MSVSVSAPPASADGDLHAKARESVKADLRGLWLEAKEAKEQGAIAFLAAKAVMVRIEVFAQRIDDGDLTPFEALALLRGGHDDN